PRAFTDNARSHVQLKLETVQPIRAFKVRGALNRITHIPAPERLAAVITASAGNHGLGVAYAAATFDTPATVYVPEGANALKVEAIRRFGDSAPESYPRAVTTTRPTSKRSLSRRSQAPPLCTPTTTCTSLRDSGPSACCSSGSTSWRSPQVRRRSPHCSTTIAPRRTRGSSWLCPAPTSPKRSCCAPSKLVDPVTLT